MDAEARTPKRKRRGEESAKKKKKEVEDTEDSEDINESLTNVSTATTPASPASAPKEPEPESRELLESPTVVEKNNNEKTRKEHHGHDGKYEIFKCLFFFYLKFTLL